MRPPTSSDLDALASFLTDPARPEGTLTLDELLGFLFAATSAPELIQFSEIFEFVFGDGSAHFATPAEAENVTGWMVGLYNQVNEGVVSGAPRPPARLVFRDPPMENFDPTCPVAQWVRGFVAGHNWLEESWDLEPPEEMEHELLANLFVLGFFSFSRESLLEDREPDEPPLEVAAERAVRLFEDAMVSYARLGRSLYLARAQIEGATPVRRDPVPGRNDPCPCGSGRKYKKCCGASVH